MEKHSIIAVLEHYGSKPINERSGWQKIKCPFHDDSHASATVNTEFEAFNCFGCGVKGDSYKIIIEQEGMTFHEAYTFAEGIARESGRPLPAINSTRRGVSPGERIKSNRRGYSPPGISRRAASRA